MDKKKKREEEGCVLQIMTERERGRLFILRL